MRMLNLIAIPAFNDNYVWLIHDGRSAVVVDPGDAKPVLDALLEHRVSLVAILLTHHHADHIGGVPELLQHVRVPVYGPASENISTVTNPLSEGAQVSIDALSITLSVLDVPGHTRGHIAYVDHNNGWLFCGDTLFCGGCGRLFEGTPAEMVGSLKKLTALPDAMQVYCAHEYTLANLQFALEVEPNNALLQERNRFEKDKRLENKATVPSTIGIEKLTNPFLRVDQPTILNRLMKEKRLQKPEPVAAFAALREWKNAYK
jgi:hydroxyacylglutathione hydrolase